MLLPELQAVVGLCSDESTRLCLYLTCLDLYHTPIRDQMPSRPRMSWRSFARVAVMDGNPRLVRWGLDMGIDTALFSEHTADALKRHPTLLREFQQLGICNLNNLNSFYGFF